MSAGLILIFWLVGVGWRGYCSLRQFAAGIDYIAIGMLLFSVAVMTSMVKGGMWSSRMTDHKPRSRNAGMIIGYSGTGLMAKFQAISPKSHGVVVRLVVQAGITIFAWSRALRVELQSPYQPICPPSTYPPQYLPVDSARRAARNSNFLLKNGRATGKCCTKRIYQ